MRLQIPPALHHRQFRLLWLGLMVSIAGSQMQLTAIHWHIRDLSGEPNPLALGGIGLARILPIMLFSLVGGAAADTFDRRRILFITQSGMAMVALSLALLTYRGQISIQLIYIFTALQAALISFDIPSRQSLIPNLVPARDLPNAFSMTSIAFNTGAILGPALAGVVIATWGLGYTYLINAFSFGAVLIALLLIGPVAQLKGKHAAKIDISSVKEGVGFIFKQPIILSTMLLDFFATFFASANTMMPIVARDILGVGEKGYGLLSSAQSIGAVLAGLVFSQLHKVRRQGTILLTSVIVFGLGTIIFGFARSFWAAMTALIVMGASDSVSTIIRNTIRQLQTPDYLRGRMTSINQIFFQGGPQLGEVEAGIVAQIFSVPIAIVTGGIGCILSVLWVRQHFPQIATYNGDEPMRAGVPAE